MRATSQRVVKRGRRIRFAEDGVETYEVRLEERARAPFPRSHDQCVGDAAVPRAAGSVRT